MTVRLGRLLFAWAFSLDLHPRRKYHPNHKGSDGCVSVGLDSPIEHQMLTHRLGEHFHLGAPSAGFLTA
jgi:hypothetical protein